MKRATCRRALDALNFAIGRTEYLDTAWRYDSSTGSPQTGSEALSQCHARLSSSRRTGPPDRMR